MPSPGLSYSVCGEMDTVSGGKADMVPAVMDAESTGEARSLSHIESQVLRGHWMQQEEPKSRGVSPGEDAGDTEHVTAPLQKLCDSIKLDGTPQHKLHGTDLL